MPARLQFEALSDWAGWGDAGNGTGPQSDSQAGVLAKVLWRRSGKPQIIDARVAKPGAFGHDYFYSNPAVSSDVILLLRHQLPPGAANGRPLGSSKDGFWFIDDRYPQRDVKPVDERAATAVRASSGE